MIISELDISILQQFYNIKKNETKVTTWTIMGRVFPNCKSDSEKRAKHNLIKSRIRKMQGDLFEIKKNGDRLVYILIGDNIRFCKHRFPDGAKFSLLIKIDSKWNAFEI